MDMDYTPGPAASPRKMILQNAEKLKTSANLFVDGR